MTDAFDQDRVEVLKHLTSQFGVSVDKAVLYESLSRKVQELKESEERFELAVTGSAAGIWDWDLASDELYASDRLMELLGYTTNETRITIEWFWNHLHPVDIAAVRQAVDKHLYERVPYHVEYRLQTSSGKYRWFLARGQALWNEAGHATRMCGSMTDITARIQAQEQLAKSEDRFRGLMEQSPLAIELLTPDGTIEQVNTAWKQLWAVSEEEAAETLSKYNMLTDPQLVERGIMPLVKRAFAGERIVLPPTQYDAARAAQDPGPSVSEGSALWIQCYLYPVKDKRGDLSFVVNTYMDITELRRVEQEAQEQREATARVSRATKMGQLTGSIAHELNQPLTGILSTAQAGEMMIRSDQMNRNELADVLAAIVSDAKRAGRVIHNLRELYKDHKAEMLTVDLNGLIEETFQMLQSEFTIRQVRATTEPASALPRAIGNRAQLQQVLVNLIMNGNEAMKSVEPSRRRLTIASQGGEREIRVWVEDCGPGIDQSQIERIFEPLATWKPGGTGMGLAISNSILESHNGYMWAENRPASGARVGFVLPVSEENPTP